LDPNRDIFSALIESHKGIIYKIAHSYCQDDQDRQDVIQEIIIQLWASLDKYDSQFKQSTWVYRIALNTAISFYRKAKVRKDKSVPLSPAIAASLEAKPAFEEDPNLKLLQGFIQELNEIDKALILLYLDGHPYKEIAAITGFSPTNVSTKIGRIKKGLKKRFQNLTH